MELTFIVGAEPGIDEPRVDGGHRRLRVVRTADGNTALCEMSAGSNETIWHASVPLVGKPGSRFVLRISQEHQPIWPFTQFVDELVAMGVSLSSIHPMQDDAKELEIITHLNVRTNPESVHRTSAVPNAKVFPPGLSERRHQVTNARWAIVYSDSKLRGVYFRLGVNGRISDLDVLRLNLRRIGQKTS